MQRVLHFQSFDALFDIGEPDLLLDLPCLAILGFDLPEYSLIIQACDSE
jgi:hypothetical protein